MGSQMKLLLIIVFFLCLRQGAPFLTARPGDCVCPGHTVVFECTTAGGVATVWQGSIFNCERMTNSISLRHSQFNNIETVVGVCNGGNIEAQAISMHGSNYTSQLNITIDTSMLGHAIQCAHDDGRDVNVIGQKTLTIDEDSLSLSNSVHLSDTHPNTNTITFSWGPAANLCPTLQYHVETNCGICPGNTTTNTTITCLRIASNDCSFTVRASTMCGINTIISGAESLRLKVPGTPIVQAIPYYSHSNQHLILIHTTFNKTGNYTIAGDVNGSATTHTINYRDVVTDEICSSAVIPASLCEESGCSHVFEISTSLCPPFTVINVTVFATNVLGNGPTSTPRIIGASNSLVNVTIDLTLSTVICEFLNQRDSTVKSCVIEYGPSRSCDDLRHKRQSNTSTVSTIATIDLSAQPELYEEIMLCFVVTASSKTFTLKVKGYFHTACDPNGLSDGTSLLDAGAQCGTPLSTLGIRGGIVCYSSYDIGSTATYSCLNCGLKSLKGSHARTCLPDGN